MPLNQANLAEVGALARLLAGQRVVTLTGAGCSTESGIPDYRGSGRGRPPRTSAVSSAVSSVVSSAVSSVVSSVVSSAASPILHDAFVRNPEVRQRYWARATIGWPRFSAARPNPAHHALAGLETAGRLLGVITQNVDRLHSAAGSQRVIELHGALAEVSCLACARTYPRARIHDELCAANAGWLRQVHAAATTPDGDAALNADAVAEFCVLPCNHCGGALKPDVVFFGGNVPAPRVAEAFALLDAAEVLLVVGSSLEVYSGFRFVRGAAERGMCVAIVNQGPTRGDALAHLRIDARAGSVLPALAAHLG